MIDLRSVKEYAFDIVVGDPDRIRVHRGDITTSHADAIVNAANEHLLPGAGVCGAIHRAGGGAVGEECKKIVQERGPVPTGHAAATTGGNLHARYVIHAVGPVWHGGSAGEPELLASCFRESMKLADGLKLASVAFPAISTGIYGYPVKNAAEVALPTIAESLRTAKSLVLAEVVLFDRATLDAFAEVAKQARGHWTR
jgi:O-acetyl-ADP-ribose deacetylase (regulator of RNase III)